MKDVYKDREIFRQPEENTTICRYFDEWKILDCLETGSLFFSRASVLDDPDEGVYPKNYDKKWGTVYPFKLGVSQFGVETNCWDEMRERTFICCFTMSDIKVCPLWNRYVKSGSGAVVQTSLKRLKESFRNDPDEDIYCSLVNYHDGRYKENTDIFWSLIHKKQEFQWENEIRVLTSIPSPKLKIQDKGVSIPINLDTFIERIILSPDAPEYLGEKIRRLCTMKGREKPIVRPFQ